MVIIDLVKFEDNNSTLDVRADTENETVWLSLSDLCTLFDKDKSVISRHISNAYKEKELERNQTVAKNATVKIEGQKRVKRNITYYNLDVVISVGYRVKSNRGVVFRRWANKVLKDYLIQGYAVNQKKLDNLGKVIDIQNRMLSYSLNIDKEEITKVINEYTRALDLLDSYDHQTLEKPKGNTSDYMMTYEEAREIIDSMKFNDKSNVFGVEKKKVNLTALLFKFIRMYLVKNYIHLLKRKQRTYYIA